MIIKELIEGLEHYYEPETLVTHSLWTEYDVVKKCKALGVELDREEIEKVLGELTGYLVTDQWRQTWKKMDRAIKEIIGKREMEKIMKRRGK